MLKQSRLIYKYYKVLKFYIDNKNMTILPLTGFAFPLGQVYLHQVLKKNGLELVFELTCFLTKFLTKLNKRKKDNIFNKLLFQITMDIVYRTIITIIKMFDFKE